MLDIQILSDIHLEHSYTTFTPKPLAPILILAGDIGNIFNSSSLYEKFLHYCSQNWELVFYVLGNHEFYSHKCVNMPTVRAQYHKLCQKYNIILLDNASFDLDATTTIIGSILWSNPISMLNKINDFQQIQGLNINYEHQLCTTYLQSEISKHQDKKLIIVTHFPPLQQGTSHPKYSSQPQPIKDYFASNFLHHLPSTPNHLTWIFGHTHHTCDFLYNNIRLISNPIGYRHENLAYTPLFTLP